jgi:uncharacterized membrane protein YhhN
MTQKWQILFAISAATVLLALLFGIQPLYVAAKPLLMITLLLYFLSASRGFPSWRLYVAMALVFSCAGDIFLISSDWFVPGLVSFLIAHVFYIIAYQKTGAANGELRAFDIIKFSVYGIFLIAVIYPGLGDMLIPVLVYAAVLLLMGIWAHKRRGATNAKSFVLVATGVMLFALSDGMIAINKFATSIPAERILIMSTYISAQYLIVQGLLKHMERR